MLEDPAEEVPDYVYQPHHLAGGRAGHGRPIITMDFERGDPVAIDGAALSPATC